MCTGALVLGAAGILDGKRATTHWAFLEHLSELGAKPVVERVVEDGKVITAAGVSAGIDMALTLAGRLAGEQVAQTIQLGIEYDPDPPFDTRLPRQGPTRAGRVDPRLGARAAELNEAIRSEPDSAVRIAIIGGTLAGKTAQHPGEAEKAA